MLFMRSRLQGFKNYFSAVSIQASALRDLEDSDPVLHILQFLTSELDIAKRCGDRIYIMYRISKVGL